MGLLFLVWGDANGKFTYLNINQKLVNWIILIRHFVKPHRDPGIFPRFKLMELTVPSVELLLKGRN